MTPFSWTTGNRFELLENGEAFFPAVLDAIAGAKEEVIIETFILFEDKIGRPLQQAMIEAGRRGVRVWITVDGYGSAKLTPEFVKALTDAGVHVVIFDPQPRLFGYRTNLFRRLHRKIVVVDGSIAFVGGINYSHDHVRDFGERSKQDYAVRVQGPVVADIHRFVLEQLDRKFKPNRSRWQWPWGRRYAGLSLLQRSQDEALFAIRDNREHRNDIEQLYRQAIRDARHEILIANAYFFPGYRLLRDLRRAAKRGVKVQLILQGNPDMPLMRSAGSTLYDFLLRAGVVIHEYCERPIHAKVAVIDRHWATVGSSNLDPLSLSLNLEANVFIRDAAFAAELQQNLDGLIRNCCKQYREQAPRGSLLSQLLRFLAFHVARHYPRWAGWLPAHAPNKVAFAPGAEVDPASAYLQDNSERPAPQRPT